MYTYGIEAMSFEIQAFLNGEYVKIADGKSYNKETGYTTEYIFDEIETTDIRVVITEMGGAIPNIAELELFNKESKALPMLDGIEKVIIQDSCINTDNPIVDDHVCEENTPKALVPIIVSVRALVTIAIVLVLVVIQKRKKEV